MKTLRPSVRHRATLQAFERNSLLLGNLLSREVRAAKYSSVQSAEFTVFSQFGEDGIIQYLLGHVPVENECFVEFGVESYEESNTRFLLVQNNWQGIIIDGSDAHISFLNKSNLIWRNNINAISRFITRENINEIFRELGVPRDLGLLSVDIDGNDFWVLEAIEGVKPRILVAEYNSLWGPELAVSVPYDPTFFRTTAHYSNLYWGASLTAISIAAEKQGLSLVGCNNAGNNAFFVRSDLLGELKALTPRDAFAEAQYRESRGKNAELTLLGTRKDKLAVISEMKLVDVKSGAVAPIGELFAKDLV